MRGPDLLVARIGRELFALSVAGVEEVVETGDLRPLEANDPALVGVTPLRGRLLPIYRADSVLGATLEDAVDLVLVLVDEQGRRVGIAVDDAEEVVAIDPDSMRAAPSRTIDARLVRGVVLHEGRLLTLLDSDALAARFAAAATMEIA